MILVRNIGRIWIGDTSNHSEYTFMIAKKQIAIKAGKSRFVIKHNNIWNNLVKFSCYEI